MGSSLLQKFVLACGFSSLLFVFYLLTTLKICDRIRSISLRFSKEVLVRSTWYLVVSRARRFGLAWLGLVWFGFLRCGVVRKRGLSKQ